MTTTTTHKSDIQIAQEATPKHIVGVAEKLGTTTVTHSGWHVYSNMEQILGKKTVTRRGYPFSPAALAAQVRAWRADCSRGKP